MRLSSLFNIASLWRPLLSRSVSRTSNIGISQFRADAVLATPSPLLPPLVAPPGRSGVFGVDASPDAFLPPPPQPLPDYGQISLEYKEEETPEPGGAGAAGSMAPEPHASGNCEGGGDGGSGEIGGRGRGMRTNSGGAPARASPPTSELAPRPSTELSSPYSMNNTDIFFFLVPFSPCSLLLHFLPIFFFFRGG